MKRNLFGVLLTAILFTPSAFGQGFTENFDDITLLAGNGWVMSNVSSPVGLTNWSQGPSVGEGGPFDAYNGAANAFISANFNNTTGSTGIISNWLMTPNRTFKNGDVITFYTRKATPDNYPDRLEVRLSTNGASTNVGSGSSVGDYTTVLLSINPSLTTGVYPTSWTMYSITVSGLAAPTSGRIGFRYFVTSAGPSGANSDFIALDNIVYTPYVCPTFTMTTSGALSGGTAGTAYSTSLTQTGALGTPSFAVTAGALPPGLTLAGNGTISGTPTATGTFNFTITVSDASGCSGSSAYSITVICPPNPTSLNGLPALCSNDGTYTLTEGLPAGGTYSGTGVSAGDFDPSNGTQLITYDYTDAYGCAHTTSNTIVVNAAPSVTLNTFAEVCEDAGSVALSGGMPAGGVYTGTGVSGGDFDPSNGTQTITYTYTDVNGCTDMDAQTLTVNPLPVVSLTPFTAVCEDNGTVTLSGGAPAGGTYSGTGVNAGMFDPSSGTQVISYSFTDGNGCSATAMESFTVNALPAVSLVLPVTELCVTDAAFALSGGTPAGGTYSGPGVSSGNFSPTTAGLGTHTVSYSYTDGNGCMAEGTAALTVGDCAGVSEHAVASLTVFPNPSNGLFVLSGMYPEAIDQLMVTDLSGKKAAVTIVETDQDIKLDLTNVRSGYYLLTGLVDGTPFRLKLEKID